MASTGGRGKPPFSQLPLLASCLWVLAGPLSAEMGQASAQMGQALGEEERAVSVSWSLRTAHQQVAYFTKMMRGGVESQRASVTALATDFSIRLAGRWSNSAGAVFANSWEI